MSAIRSLWQSLPSCAHRLERRVTLLIGSDFDGTLCPIQPDPGAVRLPPRARAVLNELRRSEGIQLGIFSGRSLEDLAARIEMEGVFLAGGGGLELQTPAGSRERHGGLEPSLASDLKHSLGSWCELFPGARIEDKGPALAIHYRAVEPSRQAAFRAGVRRHVQAYRERIRFTPGKKVFEVSSADAWDKGTALKHWVGLSPVAEPLVFYFGDDMNDEEVFVHVRGLHGVAVAVGRRRTRAEFALESALEVVWFLEWLHREWQAREGGQACP